MQPPADALAGPCSHRSSSTSSIQKPQSSIHIQPAATAERRQMRPKAAFQVSHPQHLRSLPWQRRWRPCRCCFHRQPVPQRRCWPASCRTACRSTTSQIQCTGAAFAWEVSCRGWVGVRQSCGCAGPNAHAASSDWCCMPDCRVPECRMPGCCPPSCCRHAPYPVRWSVPLIPAFDHCLPGAAAGLLTTTVCTARFIISL